MKKPTLDQLQILQLLNSEPILEGTEIVRLTQDFGKAKAALDNLLEEQVVEIKGGTNDEKQLYYSTIIGNKSKVRSKLEGTE